MIADPRQREAQASAAAASPALHPMHNPYAPPAANAPPHAPNPRPRIQIAGRSCDRGVGWSDHWSFWQVGYPAIMVTDTAPFRYPHYHSATDTPDKPDYERMARVVTGLDGVVSDLVDN